MTKCLCGATATMQTFTRGYAMRCPRCMISGQLRKTEGGAEKWFAGMVRVLKTEIERKGK